MSRATRKGYKLFLMGTATDLPTRGFGLVGQRKLPSGVASAINAGAAVVGHKHTLPAIGANYED